MEYYSKESIDNLIEELNKELIINDMYSLFMILNHGILPVKRIGNNALWGINITIIKVYDDFCDDHYIIVSNNKVSRMFTIRTETALSNNSNPYYAIYSKVKNLFV